MRISNRVTLSCFAVLLGLALCSSEAMAQGGGRGGGGGGGRGGQQRGGGGTTLATLLQKDEVKEILELSPDQEDQLEEVRNDRGGFDRDQIREDMEGMSNEDRTEYFRELMAKRTSGQTEKIKEILLDHQFERAEQLLFQFGLRNGQATQETLELLGLNLEEQEIYKEAEVAMLKEFKEEAAELLKKKFAKLRKDNLTASQNATFDEKAGEIHTFAPEEARGRGGRGGDAGGRGGQQGGGRGGQQGGGRGGDKGGGQGGGRGGDKGGGQGGGRGGDKGGGQGGGRGGDKGGGSDF